MEETLLPAQDDDVLELDEMWPFVLKKTNKCWLWTTICRRPRQIVAYVLGDRSEAACGTLWSRLPESYETCRTFSDFWSACRNIFPVSARSSVSKETGRTCHAERWNNTCRQFNAGYARKTLPFSKNALHHKVATRLFVIRYNPSRKALLAV